MEKCNKTKLQHLFFTGQFRSLLESFSRKVLYSMQRFLSSLEILIYLRARALARAKHHSSVINDNMSLVWKFTMETVTCVRTSLPWTRREFTYFIYSRSSVILLIYQDWRFMSEIGQHVLNKANLSGEKKMIVSPILGSGQGSRKRKAKSEPLPGKRKRTEDRVC